MRIAIYARVSMDDNLAKIEAQKISERTKADRARAKGKRIGRPALPRDIRAEICERSALELAPAAIAKALGVDRKSVAKYAQA